MNKYETFIIAFLDILGFKNIVNTSSFDKILDIFKSIITNSEAAIALWHAVEDDDTSPAGEGYKRYNESLEKTKIHIMSDSIVVATPSWHPESLAVVVDICNSIQELLFNLDAPILLRGAIAVGDFYLNENLVFGKGLVDAYWAQEKYAIYPRIIISNDITVGRRVSVDNGNDLPKDEDGYYYINCIERYLGEERTWTEIESSEQYVKLKDMIDRNLNAYNDDRVRQKYLWLERELERIENKGYVQLVVRG